MGGDGGAGVQDPVQVAAHIADAGDAVGEEEREDEVGAVIGHAVEVDMGMHIPQAGDEVLALGVDDLPCSGSVFAGMLDAEDAVALDDDGGFGVYCAVGNVDELRVRDGERLRGGIRGEGKGEKEALDRSHQSIVPADGGCDQEGCARTDWLIEVTLFAGR